MKLIRNITIIYTALMVIALLVMLSVIGKVNSSMDTVGSYSAEELEIYKSIWGNMKESISTAKNELTTATIIFWLVVLFIGYLIISLIYYTQIRPIVEMEKYALEIAKGNLDVPLPMHRGNMFSSFTESFDLMREELRMAKLRELEADKAKRELVAELSHDIKTPVATIQATCEVVQAKYADDKDVMEKIGIISARTETINQLISNLLQSTMAELEELEIKPSENSSEMIEEYFSEHKQSVKIIFDDQIPKCLVYIDPLRMEQAIDNVISNSIKYAGTDIHVGFSTVEGPKNESGKSDSYIKIRIKDSGPGIPEEDLPMITEKYFRGSNTGDKPGYGLGMNLVKTYMEKQGGGLEYYNDGGFVVELLVKKV